VTGKAAKYQEMREKVIGRGNVEGVAASRGRSVTGGEGEPYVHTVENGETLWANPRRTLAMARTLASKNPSEDATS